MRRTNKGTLFSGRNSGLSWLLFFVLVYAFLPCGLLQADDSADPLGLVIVINLDNEVSSMDDDELRRLFTGKSLRFSNGARAALAVYMPESAFFNKKLLNMSNDDVSALWSRLKFSGRSRPPRAFDSVEELVEYVASTPNALAYMPASALREGVRVIATLPR